MSSAPALTGEDSLPAAGQTDPTESNPSFSHIGHARARRAKECAQELELLAGRFPELARLINKSIRAIRDQAGRTPASDRDRILTALEDGNHTFQQIAEHADLPYPTVYKLLRQSPLVHLVDFRESPPLIEPGRGGRRRPEILIFLKHG